MKFVALSGQEKYVFYNAQGAIKIDKLYISYGEPNNNEIAGINNANANGDGKFFFGGKTTFTSVSNTQGHAYGIKDVAANTQDSTVYTFGGSLRFQSIRASNTTNNAEAIGLDILNYRSKTFAFQDNSASALIFDSIVGDTAMGTRFGGTGNNLALANSTWIFNGIRGNTREVGIDIQGNINLEKKSALLIALNGKANNSYAFSAQNSSNKEITLDNSILAFDFNNSNAKISETQNSVTNTLTLTLNNSSRLIFGASTRSGDVDLGVIDNLKGEGTLQANFNQNTADLSQTGNNIIDLSVHAVVNAEAKNINQIITTPALFSAQKRSHYKTLTIGSNKSSSKGLQGNNLVFRLYADENKGDKVKIEKADISTGKQHHYFQVNVSKEDKLVLEKSGFKNEIVLVEVKKDYKDSVLFDGLNAKGFKPNNAQFVSTLGDYVLLEDGFNNFVVDIEKKWDGSNEASSNYWQYFIPAGSKLLADGLDGTYAQTGVQANLSTYQIFVANLNSLNKRMGELRDNENSKGFWSRVYNGQQQMDFGTGSNVNYTSVQLGLDEGLNLQDSKLYFGGAFTYSFGKSEFNSVRTDRAAAVLNASTLNSLDLAAYMSYVEYGEKGGFYSDSIAKFSYIMNALSTTKNEHYQVNAMGGSFSQEFGYRANLPLGFFIDPQAEVSYAYLGGQDFTQTHIKADTGEKQHLKFSQNGVHTIRSRVGVNWGFDFKDFFEKNSKANAKLYLGTYYVFDYIHGGEIGIDNLDGWALSTNPYLSTGRAVLNFGTNVSFTDGTKLYLDFERSFGGKITTEYQVNLGVRVGFGDKVEKRINLGKPFKQPHWKMTPKSEEEKKKPVNWKASSKPRTSPVQWKVDSYEEKSETGANKAQAVKLDQKASEAKQQTKAAQSNN